MKLKITLHGVEHEVDVDVLDNGNYVAPSSPLPVVARAPQAVAPAKAATPAPAAASAPAGSGDGLKSPVGGTVIDVLCKEGSSFKKGDTLVVVEAMKMHTKLTADKDGKVARNIAKKGENVKIGQLLVEFA